MDSRDGTGCSGDRLDDRRVHEGVVGPKGFCLIGSVRITFVVQFWTLDDCGDLANRIVILSAVPAV